MTLYKTWERQGAEGYSQFLSVRGLLHSLQEQAGVLDAGRHGDAWLWSCPCHLGPGVT